MQSGLRSCGPVCSLTHSFPQALGLAPRQAPNDQTCLLAQGQPCSGPPKRQRSDAARVKTSAGPLADDREAGVYRGCLSAGCGLPLSPHHDP